MKKIKVFHDAKGNTLTVWFDEPSKEAICEEIGEDMVLMKDKSGKVIGVEKLNYIIPFTKDYHSLPVEVISA